MLVAVHPKLPMRDREVTRAYYVGKLGFRQFGGDYADYLMVEREGVQLHFFAFRELDPLENYGQVYVRVEGIEGLYREWVDGGVEIHPAGHLGVRAWGQKEFSLLDPDGNLLTFGEGV